MKSALATGDTQEDVRRAPYGARGLKSMSVRLLPELLMSRPVWGAWIEI